MVCKQRNLWVGAAVTSRLHFDALDNIHTVWAGRKVANLYSPFDSCVVHASRQPGALNNWAAAQSVFQAARGDSSSPPPRDGEASPEMLLRRAKTYRAEGAALDGRWRDFVFLSSLLQLRSAAMFTVDAC